MVLTRGAATLGRVSAPSSPGQPAEGFDPLGFISGLVDLALTMQQQADRQQALLEASEGSATVGGVTVRVGYDGALKQVEFAERSTAAILGRETMAAYVEACAQANRATAASMLELGEGVSKAIRASVPDDLQQAAERQDRDGTHEVDQPATPGYVPAPQPRTIADLPPDPELDEFLAALTSAQTSEDMRQVMATSATQPADLSLGGAEFERRVAEQVRAITEAGPELSRRMRAATGTHQSELVEVVVGAMGNLSSVVYRPRALQVDPDELAKDLLDSVRKATATASQQALEAVQELGLDTADDPTVRQLRELSVVPDEEE